MTYEELLAATDRLVQIKSAISLANAPIQNAIYRAAELRGTAAFLRGLPIQDGPSPAYYGAASTVFEAAMNAADIEEKVETLESEADDLQDQIDTHNATVRISMSDD